MSKLAIKYPARRYKWGFRPANEILEELGELDNADDGKPWTIGFGNTVNVTHYGKTTFPQSRTWMIGHIAKNLRELDRLMPDWHKRSFPVQTVLVNLMYNMGYARLAKFVNTLRYIQQDNYTQAAANLEKSLWYNQVGDRARELVQRVRTNSIEPQHLVPY